MIYSKLSCVFAAAIVVGMFSITSVEADCPYEQGVPRQLFCENFCGYSFVYHYPCESSYFRYYCVYGGWAMDYCGRWNQPFTCWWDSPVAVEYYQTGTCAPDPNV
jgi:hypothetical protein